MTLKSNLRLQGIEFFLIVYIFVSVKGILLLLLLLLQRNIIMVALSHCCWRTTLQNYKSRNINAVRAYTRV